MKTFDVTHFRRIVRCSDLTSKTIRRIVFSVIDAHIQELTRLRSSSTNCSEKLKHKCDPKYFCHFCQSFNILLFTFYQTFFLGLDEPTEPLKHVNLFEDLESGETTASANKDHEAEKTKEKEDYEKKIGLLTYLGQDSQELTGERSWWVFFPPSAAASKLFFFFMKAALLSWPSLFNSWSYKAHLVIHSQLFLYWTFILPLFNCN